MDESESKNEKPKKERRLDPELLKKGLRCDRDQYERLTEEGVETWNKWRLENTGEDILLEGANLGGRDLKGVYLNSGTLKDDDKHWFKGRVYLKGANFYNAHLESALLTKAHLEGAQLKLAHLEGADLLEANLKGASLMGACLQGSHFIGASVDGSTLIWKPKVNWAQKKEDWNFTDFSGVALDSVRIDPPTKQLLEYNVRRKYWEKWYREKNWYEIFTEEDEEEDRSLRGRIIREPIRWFWAISDYGRSTGRIIFTFFGLALIFANIYYYWGAMDYYILHYILRVDGQPGFVSYLFVDKSGVAVSWWLVPLRTLYFSIVMTTLGFGDMYANAQSIWGHILLSLQVILGYVLLGALVTRFAVLFTAGGPAGKFADEKEKETKESKSE